MKPAMSAPRKPPPVAAASTGGPAALPQPAIRFGPGLRANLEAAEQREWLVTNGIGGFASGSLAGSSTRRYHGLLVAALDPPARRTALVSGLDEVFSIDGEAVRLATHRWTGGAVDPAGYLHIESFRLDGAIPVWTYRAGTALLEKRVWMKHGENTAFVDYTVLKAAGVVDFELKALVNYRDFHASTHAGDWRMSVDPIEHGVRVTAFEGAQPFYLRSTTGTAEPRHVWYRDFFFPAERERGLDASEDQLFAALFRGRLAEGEGVTVVLSTEAESGLGPAAALEEERKRQAAVLAAADGLLRGAAEGEARARLSQLVLAADQFVVDRGIPGGPQGKSLIAGYHWFGDWGRDTMIALPGLALSTGRPEIARQILLAFSRFVDGGMLPNNFPDAGGVPQYNTIDATLWYFEAIRQYVRESGDLATLKALFPVLAGIVEAHLSGTRYNIQVDPADGLLYGGGPGVQLTWMDAKIGDWVVTPRTGKPVEINALWINALEAMVQFAPLLGRSAKGYQQRSAAARAGFPRFWNSARGCCFDVLDSPGAGNDPALRPNQIFAVSLEVSPLSPAQQKAVVDCCSSHLLTPLGLRSLAPGEPGYAGAYAGGPRERDSVYHQGAAWGWLLGPFALAHYRVYRDRDAARGFLEPLAGAVDLYGLGSLGELYDGDSPHKPRGCIAQAWTVGELLRAWRQLGAA
jgi:predicted glycogen debranching enzyme